MKIPKITTLEKHQETVNLDRKSKKSNRTMQVHPINLSLSKVSLSRTEHRKMANFLKNFWKDENSENHDFGKTPRNC